MHHHPTVVMNDMELEFELEPQKGSRLCWAAVSVAIARYYKEKKVPGQMAFAEMAAGKRYNQFYAPDKALAICGNFRQKWDRPLRLPEIVDELKGGHPVAACMKYFVGWHLVVIYGITRQNELMIADSLLGNSRWPVDRFTHQYNKHYQWVFTYTTQKSVDR